MIYDFLGKKITRDESHKELLMNPKIDLGSAYVFLGAQNKCGKENRKRNGPI